MSLEEKGVAEEETSFVDSVLGGEDHSPAEEAENPVTPPAETKAAGDELIPEDEAEDSPFADEPDSVSKEPEETKAPEEKPPVENVDDAKLKQELEGLRKRLHDTQSAFHKATGERAALQKELDALKAKQNNEDDWFSEDDKGRVEKLEAELKRSDEEISRTKAEADDAEKKSAVAQWDADAAPVIKEHPDFEELLYGKLVPMLDPQTGNPQVRAAWNALKDKSPAGQYEFAKNIFEALEFQRDPKAYKEKLRKELSNSNANPGTENDDGTPIGKDGLDMLNSADPSNTSSEGSVGSFVDAVFG